jgi:hypothetical protein
VSYNTITSLHLPSYLPDPRNRNAQAAHAPLRVLSHLPDSAASFLSPPFPLLPSSHLIHSSLLALLTPFSEPPKYPRCTCADPQTRIPIFVIQNNASWPLALRRTKPLNDESQRATTHCHTRRPRVRAFAWARGLVGCALGACVLIRQDARCGIAGPAGVEARCATGT